MATIIKGIHHITAIAGDAKRNFDFYTKVLGLRFVKRTVNLCISVSRAAYALK